jgi:hypothetical protein
MLKPVEFPWRDAIDAMEWVTSPKVRCMREEFTAAR